MIRRPPRSTQSRSSAASDVYKRQRRALPARPQPLLDGTDQGGGRKMADLAQQVLQGPVSYTHLRAHETPEHLVCRLLLDKKNPILRTIISSTP